MTDEPVAEPTAEPSPDSQEKNRKWLPLVLSAGICPGLGQWTQGRKLMGVVYLVAFLGFFVLTMVAILRPFLQTIDYIKGERHEPAEFQWLVLLGNFFMCILVYAINVWDVWLAEKKRRRKKA